MIFKADLSAQFITGGVPVDISDYPFAVGVGKVDNGEYSHMGGGTIISETFIITAAHFPILPTHVRAGANNIITLDDGAGQSIAIKNYIIHPDFDNNNSTFGPSNDIALIELEEPLQFNAKVQPIDMLEENFEFSENQEIVILGWSDIDFSTPFFTGEMLQMAVLDFKSNATAFSMLEGTGCENDIHPSMFSYQKSGVSSNMGDSGGPTLVTHNGELKLAGPVSWGCSASSPPPSTTFDINPNFSADVRTTFNQFECDLFATELSGSISGVFDEGPYVVTDDLVISGDCSFLNSVIYASPQVEIRISSGVEFTAAGCDFLPCDPLSGWTGMLCEDGSDIELNRVRISNAFVAINSRTESLFLHDVAIRNSNLAGLALANQSSVNEITLEFVRFLDNSLGISARKAKLRLKGCKFSNSPVQLNGCETRLVTLPNPDGITEARCAFYNSPTTIDGGPLYSVGWAYYDQESAVTSEDCDFVNICWSRFEKEENVAVSIDGFNRHFFYGNIFENSSSNVEILSGTSDGDHNGIFSNNISINTSEVAVTGTDPKIEYWCNHHDENQLAYRTPGGTSIPQGTPNHPAGNLFLKENNNHDIEHASSYTYYWNRFVPQTEPDVSDPLNFDSEDVELKVNNDLGCGDSSGSLCCRKDFILNVWNNELCPPGTWYTDATGCLTECILCIDCLQPPEPGESFDVDTPVGKVAGNFNNTNAFSAVVSESDYEATTYNISQTKNNRVLIYNFVGQLLYDMNESSDEILFNEHPTGTYVKLTINKESGSITQEKIFVP